MCIFPSQQQQQQHQHMRMHVREEFTREDGEEDKKERLKNVRDVLVRITVLLPYHVVVVAIVDGLEVKWEMGKKNHTFSSSWNLS